MTTYSSDGFFPSYKLVSKDDWDSSLQSVWNRRIRELNLPFRTFTVGSKSTKQSRARWFHYYLLKHRAKFGYHYDAESEDVYEGFSTALYIALSKLAEMGCETATERLQRPINARLTIWRFIDPPEGMLFLAGMLEEPPQEIERRREKARILRQFDQDIKEFRKRAVYLSGSDEQSNARLSQALELARQALAQAEDDLSWQQR